MKITKRLDCDTPDTRKREIEITEEMIEAELFALIVFWSTATNAIWLRRFMSAWNLREFLLSPPHFLERFRVPLFKPPHVEASVGYACVCLHVVKV